jgi:hypothetical protein
VATGNRRYLFISENYSGEAGMEFLSTKGIRCFSKALVFNVLACIALAISTQANASSVSVFMNLSNNQTVFPDGTNYLEVTVRDGNNGDIDFSLATLGPLHNLVPDWDNFGISAFKFNFGDSGATLANLLLPLEWGVSQDDGGWDDWLEFELFDAFLTGDYLKTTLNFSIFGVDGDTPEDYLPACSPGESSCALLIAEVMGLSDNPNFKDIWPMDPSTAPVRFADSVVPLPPAAWLFISAIAMLGWMRHRNNARFGEVYGLPG